MDVDNIDLNAMLHYYKSGADFPVSYSLAKIDQQCNAYCIQEYIDEWSEIPDTKTPVWAVTITFLVINYVILCAAKN